MTSNINRSPKDFFKLKDLDKKEDRYEENVNAILDENDLYRKKLPKGPNSLMRALSEVLFFHPHQHAEMQQSVLTLLTQLIASNKLTPRLSSFQGNSIMLKDFANNPQLTGFEKINLELIALFYNVKVILYTMNEDHYLGATIFNHNYKHTIEIFRTKASQYDALFPKSFIKKAGICQNIVLNIIDKALNGTKPNQWKNLNDDEFINITYESSLAKNQPSKDHVNIDQFRITRGNHKKSLSDNFNNNWEMMEEQQMKFYDAFLNVSNHDDFLKNFEKNRKDTAESGFSINANFDFIDDQNLDTPFQGREFAMKNYPISSKGLSPRGVSHVDMDSSPMPAFTKTKFSDHANVLFNDNLSLNEIERLEKTVNSATTIDPKQMSSPFYRNISPPGLSPTKYSQRTFTDAIQTPQSELLSSSPQINRESISPMYHYGGVNSSPAKRNIAPFMGGYQEPDMYHMPNLNQRQYSDPNIQSFAPQAQMMNPQGQGFPSMQSHQYNNMGMKKMDPMGYPQNMGYGQQMGYDQGGYEQGVEYDDMMYNQNGVREKKKPIILDEGKERYRGRLKFFDENKKYGFIIMEEDGSDIFVHYDDLCKAGIPKESLRAARSGTLIQMTFSCMAYIGKYSKSRKAVDIQLI